MDYASVLKIIVLFSGWILYLSYFKQEQQRKTFGNGSSKGEEMMKKEEKAVVPYLRFYKEFCPYDERSTGAQIPTIKRDPNHKGATPPKPTESTKPTNEVQQFIQKAKRFINSNRAKAIDLLNHAHKMDPTNAEVLVLIGTVKVESNDVADADKYFSRALQVNPSHELALQMRSKTKAMALTQDQKRLEHIDSSKVELSNRFRSSTNSNSRALGDLMKVVNEHYYQFIYHTIAIEGNTLTPQQVREVLSTGKAPLGADVRELAEVIGMEAAIQLVNRTIEFPITEAHILALHRRVLSSDPDNGGEYRRHQVFVGNFAPPDETQVPRMMSEFAAFLQSEDFQSMHPIRQAALAHHRLTYIHPFVDGNGRTARLLMNQILLASDYPYVNIRTADRLDYYRVLDEASKGDILEFERFLMNRMQDTMDLYLKTLDPDRDSVGQTAQTSISDEHDEVDPFRASVIEL